MSWFHRTYSVSHSRDGFHLRVTDEWWPAFAADRLVDGVLDGLGHPCCGRGPLGWLVGIGVSWWRVLNLTVPLHRRDRSVVSVPLTDGQALAIAPWNAELLRDPEDE